MWHIRLICLVAIITAAVLTGGRPALDVIRGGMATLGCASW